MSVAINLSPQLLNDLAFPDQVARMAAQVGADARRIIFEVTESAAMFDPGTTMDVLTRMRVKNFGLSIDDFGTGYSSLKQLYLMPFSELKIDTSFVRDIFAHEDARTMVETMVLLAHKLRLTACAEGVESQEILDFLDSVECDRAQGYFIGRPMPGDALEARRAGVERQAGLSKRRTVVISCGPACRPGTDPGNRRMSPQIRDKWPLFALNLPSRSGIQTTNAIGERRL